MMKIWPTGAIAAATLGGATAVFALCYYCIQPATGVCESFHEQAKLLHLTSRFQDFPAVGPTEWKRFDRLRNAYRVKGRIRDLQSYLDWRFGPGVVEVDEFQLAKQNENPVIGEKDDRYLNDGFDDNGHHLEFRVLNTGEFFFDFMSNQ